MPRRRLAVALLLGRESSLVIDLLRRAVGATDADLERIPPHVTLVPPSQVPTETVPEVWEEVRQAARRVEGPLRLELGPVASFVPTTPTIHLEVGAEVGLNALRGAASVDALDRRQSFDFVPHVTLRQEAPQSRISAAIEALADLRIEAEVRRLWLMQFQSLAGSAGRWEPVGDVSLGPAQERPLGTSTMEVAVSITRCPSALGLLRDALGRVDIGAKPPLLLHPSALARVLVARVDSRVAGVAEMSYFERDALLHYVFVGSGHQGEGIGRALVREAIDLMVAKRVRHLDAWSNPDLPGSLLEAYGFKPVDAGTWRITLSG